MSNRLPNIFKNSNLANTGNNKASFYSFKEGLSSLSVVREDRASKDNIEELFNMPVEIVTRSGVKKCRIISKIKDHILTSDNEKILLNDIMEIKKNRL